MTSKTGADDTIRCSIAPWLTVGAGAAAIDFYKAAFGATEAYRLDIPGGDVVARLSVDGAEFWLNSGAPGRNLGATEDVPIRMILTVADPDGVFDRALKAGAAEVFPVGEEHGWRLGRLVDPFGHHWEIGRPLSPNDVGA